jgi:flavin-dependent dehydrogenase
VDIQAKHIATKKRIGTLKGKPVVELTTHGGLNLVVTETNGKTTILGSGPHRGVSRWLAMKKEPDLVITELSKSDWLDEASILSVSDRYLALTERMNQIIAGE